MLGAETPLPPNPGEPVPSVPPVGQADGTPLRYGGLGVSAPHIFRHVIYCVRISISVLTILVHSDACCGAL
jgi:hypothetical protein